MSRSRLEIILDECIEDVRTGRRTLEESLARWPQRREALEPLLRAAVAARQLALPVPAPDAARRAAFMRAIRTTPQQSRRGAVASVLAMFSSWRRQMLLVAPAAVAVAIALVLSFGRSTPAAEASTLTIFSGGVEAAHGDSWTALKDGMTLRVGTRLRTDASGRALLTFADGSTVALDPQTEMGIVVASTNGPRTIVLRQDSGRLWHQVAPDPRAGAQFTVQTATATVIAHGTVFETTIVDGATTVSTAEGTVEVVAGSQHVQVTGGEGASASADAVRTLPPPAQTAATGALVVDAPFVASVIGPDGRATGAFPSGMVYQQIPGAVSSDPSNGPQRIDFSDVHPGEYTVLLRRTHAGEGSITFSIPGSEQTIALDAGNDAVVLQLQITSAGGQVRLAQVAIPQQTDNAAAVQQERVIVTEQAKERIEQQRKTSSSPAETPGLSVTSTPESGEDRGTSSGTAEPTRTSPLIVPSVPGVPVMPVVPVPTVVPVRPGTLLPLIPRPTATVAPGNGSQDGRNRGDDQRQSRDDH